MTDLIMKIITNNGDIGFCDAFLKFEAENLSCIFEIIEKTVMVLLPFFVGIHCIVST